MIDKATAKRMALASNATYYVEVGVSSSPGYEQIGFVEAPTLIMADEIVAALVGVTKTEIIIAFRGTLPFSIFDDDGLINSICDWAGDSAAKLVPVYYSPGLVHHGFQLEIEAIWVRIFTALAEAEAKHSLPVIFTGHSKGGGFAALAAIRYCFETRVAAHESPTVVTFAAPRSMNGVAAVNYEDTIKNHIRFENAIDIVPHVPAGVLFLSLLGLIDGRLRSLKSYEYAPLGDLIFLGETGSVVYFGSWGLEFERNSRLWEAIALGQIGSVADHHSIEKSYLPKLDWLMDVI